MAASLKIDNDVKDRFDRFQEAMRAEAAGGDVTQTDALAALLDIAERREAGKVLDESEAAGAAMVRKMLASVGDEMVSILIHGKNAYGESLRKADEERAAIAERAEELAGERDGLAARVAELEPYADEVLRLREKVAELDETRGAIAELVGEIAASRKENSELREKVAELVRGLGDAER